jgi:hypothetical protein
MIPRPVSAEIVLFETLMLVGFAPNGYQYSLLASRRGGRSLTLCLFTTLPVTLALSVPEASTMPTGCSALASEILPMLLLEMVTPLIP